MNAAPDYLTVPQAAERLGITAEWLRELIRRRKIAAERLGHWGSHYRLRVTVVEAYIEQAGGE